MSLLLIALPIAAFGLGLLVAWKLNDWSHFDRPNMAFRWSMVKWHLYERALYDLKRRQRKRER